jgi:hypothetical protein
MRVAAQHKRFVGATQLVGMKENWSRETAPKFVLMR